MKIISNLLIQLIILSRIILYFMCRISRILITFCNFAQLLLNHQHSVLPAVMPPKLKVRVADIWAIC